MTQLLAHILDFADEYADVIYQGAALCAKRLGDSRIAFESRVWRAKIVANFRLVHIATA
jgi:hypothetical protein